MTNPRELGPEDLRLRAAGFDPAAPPEQALACLRALHGQSEIDDGAIARALGSLKIAAAADLLATMERAASGPVRREIRRALFRLRQAGIAPSAEPPSSAGAPAPAQPSLEGLMSPIDATGVRLVWISKPRPGGGMKRLWGFASETEGLVGCSLGPVTRRELKRDRQAVEQRAGVKMIEADWRLCDFILCEAYRATPEGKRGAVGNFFALRAELIATPADEHFVHPVYGELGVQSAGEPSLELLKEPEILAWRFPPDQLKPYLDEIAELQNSVIVLNPMQQEERIGAVVEKAIGGLLAGEHAPRARRRLEDIAYYLAHSGRRQAAGWATTAAASVRDGAELRRIQFFQNLVRTMLGASIAERQEKAREEPRLIVTPAEAMRAQSQQSRRR